MSSNDLSPGASVAIVAVALCFYGAALYIALHFIIKWW